MITKDSIIIKGNVKKVFKIARDIENQHLYIPGYEPARIITRRKDGRLVIERTAVLKDRKMSWRSLVRFVNGKAIEFEQIEGRLKGMKIEWLFRGRNGKTELTITHELTLKPPLIGWFVERLAAKPAIDRLTRNVLTGLKNHVERGHAGA
jgi:ribosome-associated toxin RatA of RatAB toxin-antitoxin module